MLYSLSYSQLLNLFHCTTTAPPTPTGVTAQYVNASSVKVTWQWTSSDPAPSCFNTTTVTYHPEGGGESSLQLSDPAATETTLTDLQCNTNYTITVVATAGGHRREGVAFLSFQGIYYSYIHGNLHVFHKCFVCTGTSSTCQEVSCRQPCCQKQHLQLIVLVVVHPVTLVLNHPVILGQQVSVGSNVCFGCTYTCTMQHDLSLLGMKYSLVPSPLGVWKRRTELNNSSSNRTKWAHAAYK